MSKPTDWGIDLFYIVDSVNYQPSNHFGIDFKFSRLKGNSGRHVSYKCLADLLVDWRTYKSDVDE